MKKVLVVALMVAATLATMFTLSPAARWSSVDTGTSNIRIPLGGDTYICAITAHVAGIDVFAYDKVDGTMARVDSTYIWPGTCAPLYVIGYDSLVVTRESATRVDYNISKHPAISPAPSYMRRFTKTCPMTHGDTLAVGGTVTYTQDEANKAAHNHAGICVYFESLHIIATGQDLTQKLGTVHVKMWMGEHQVFNGVIPANEWEPIDFCRFDSLTITDNNDGTLDYISWAVSWNNRL